MDIFWLYNLSNMSAFSIDHTASEEIGRIFSLSQLRDPVAEIIEIGESLSLLVSGNETKQELASLARAYAKKAPNYGSGRVHILAHERTDFWSIHLREIDGITFVMAWGLSRALSDIRLTFDGERFLLIGSDNTMYTLRSLARRRWW